MFSYDQFRAALGDWRSVVRVHLVLYQSPLLNATSFEKRTLPPAPQAIGDLDVGALKVATSLRLHPHILLIIFLTITRSDPCQPVVTAGIQKGIQLLRRDLGGLETFSERSPAVISMQRLKDSPLLTLITQWTVSHLDFCSSWRSSWWAWRNRWRYTSMS